MSLKNRIKKFLCKTGSIYEDGKLRVPAGLVIFWGIFSIAIIYVIGWIFYSLITEPIKTMKILGLIAGAIGLILLIGRVVEYLIPQALKTYFKLLASKLELTCDRTVFPEEVKGIFAQTEALDEEKKDYFLRGIHALLRKMGADE